MREPWPGELAFFRSRPDVAGLAAEDDCVVLNPYSNLNDDQKSAVALNEAVRIVMRRDGLCPDFDLTITQKSAFASYGPIDAIRATIVARIVSGDPSACEPTPEQVEFAKMVARKMDLTTR
jgi:hypothetical protein